MTLEMNDDVREMNSMFKSLRRIRDLELKLRI